MKKKELKALAVKIAKAEKKLQETQDSKGKALLEQEIMSLSGRVNALEDMILIDEMVQEILKKNS